ncbi:glycosyl hydrolase family 28-related protein [Mesorhizobium sp. LNJC405B00]|uniref:glycosyl hydrolase family 28-related protein n=1 Tax=Mesorhizobium sp. LNJC405B00 TaxID=1287281 RepID=UPI0003CF8BF3|nr:glycosyl hydrolase family 28-related protein [Mesorhizobium sp. LNJC405B00]ESY02284.1 head decoration protein [Mesorhizobium sp. LNJC405B00]
MATTSVDQVTGYGETVAYKAPCRLATTANIALSGLQTIDGSVTAANDRVLVKDQTDPRENGIYIASTGLWARARDMDSNRDLTKGTRVSVTDGTAGASTTWVVTTTNPISIGTSSIAFVTVTFGPFVVLDEDDMVSNSASAVPTQQSVKAYADTKIAASVLTTRGDIMFRNATLPARLAASTAGYLLQTAGAGADPAWAGFLQSGTSAVTRTWQDKARERVSVKDFGAVGDGVTVDTTAIQAAETYRASVGGELVFPPGDYLIAGVTVGRANGGGWRGLGNVRLLPTANSVILIDVTGAVISSTLSKVFYVDGIEFNFNSKTSVTGYRESAPYLTRISRCKFNRLQFSTLFTSPNSATQTGWITISDVDQIGDGSWLFRGFDDTRYIFNININNFNQQGTGAAPWTGVNALFHFQRAVSVYLNNVNAASLDGGAKGVYMQGDCQGVFLNNVIIGWPTYGVHAVAWTDTLIPSYVYINNCGMDQPTVKGFDIAGRTWRIANTNSTNGYLRGSTGPALELQATATDITVRSFLAAYMNHDGIKVNVGAAKVVIANVTSENNNQNAGGNFDLNLTSCSFVDVVMEGRSYIGTAGVNATGQRVVNGTTSKEVSRNTGSVATTAIITQEDLMTYTIPASVLKVGQKVRLTAWGTTAANANGKTIRLWFGGNSIIDHNGAWNATPWRMTSELVITGASAQEYFGVAIPTAVVPTARQGTLTVTDTATIIVKATGQNAVATAADITCQGFTVEIID